MLTLRSAAGLLRAADSLDDLEAVGKAIGFEQPFASLDLTAREALGLDPAGEARVAPGSGSLRALLLRIPDDDGRGAVARIGQRLLRRAPHVLWTILAVDSRGRSMYIAVPSPGSRGTRTSILVVDRGRVMDSDAETLRQLAAAVSMNDLATHSRFAEILGRDALTRRFFRKLQECVAGLASSTSVGSSAARAELALLYSSRLLFLGFLESKGWLDGDGAFLGNTFDRCMNSGGGFHGRVLLPLFFGTLNTPRRRRAPRARAFGRIPFLNGGLFTPTPSERALRSLRFSDAAMGEFLGGLLARYRFTTVEESSEMEEAAVDPEMLGRAFESLMNADARRTSGAFYTPHELVERVTTCGLEAFLAPGVDDVQDAVTLERLEGMRVLDPACGSGAFLVHALGRLSGMRVLAGDRRAPEVIRREVLARSIFGVDINPTAVWLCQLRLWLAIVVDSPDAGDGVSPLPNLDRNIRVGDSLAGAAFDEVGISGGPALQRLRERYIRSNGTRKGVLGRQLDREERRLVVGAITAELSKVSAARRDLVAARRGRDLFGGRYQASRGELADAAELRAVAAGVRRRLKSARNGGPLPFAFPAHFADVAADGGFSLIVGNPPWVRPHNVDAQTRETLRRRYIVARAAPWMEGANAAGAGKGFASQVDLAAIFVERSVRLLGPSGVLSLLLPSKLWRSLSAGGVRQLLLSDTRLLRVEDYADTPATFDAAVYPGLLVATRNQSARPDVAVTVLHRSRTAACWRIPDEAIALDRSSGAPWLLLPAEVRRAFDFLRECGTPLGETSFGRPLLGVKCGLNEAFIVKSDSAATGSARVVAANGREGLIESSWLRPVLRGEQVRAGEITRGDESIIWTHGPDGNPAVRLADGIARWLQPYRRSLVARADARRTMRWWSVFRTEAAASDRPRVIWADIGQSLRAAVIPAGDQTVPLNSCYVVRCPSDIDARALCTLLNSPLITAWLSVIAEPARGGYRRYLGWTMSMLPIPRDWESVRLSLGDRNADPEAQLRTLLRAYGLRPRDVEPLLTWAAT